MPKKNDGKIYVHKTITITQEQVEFLESKSMSLSKFVQNKINEEMGIKKAGK